MSAEVINLGGGVHRGTSNRNVRGSADDRRRRREWLIETYRADADLYLVRFVDGTTIAYPIDTGVTDLPNVRVAACRCYRCGVLLHTDAVLSDGSAVTATVTVDRIVPGCRGGTYKRSNIRPACGPCNSETGSRTRR